MEILFQNLPLRAVTIFNPFNPLSANKNTNKINSKCNCIDIKPNGFDDDVDDADILVTLAVVDVALLLDGMDVGHIPYGELVLDFFNMLAT